MSAGLNEWPRVKNSSAAKSMQRQQKTVHKLQTVRNNKNEFVLKIECCGSYGQLPTKRKIFVDCKAKSKREAL